MPNFLYTIFIYPVYMLVEFIYFIAASITEDKLGFSIIILSFTINLICLPLYNIAEKLQEKERAVQKLMKAKIADIKAIFKGDERYLILSTYYRQNNYHPVYALRSVFPLFIQIPFFFAAYSFLSHLSVMNNASFLFLHDMAMPDGLLKIGSVSINILPIVMTVFNIIASWIYAKDFGLKDKLQLYITAAVFLVILYYSPSGLVFYWTLNNIFSLCKNIFYRFRSVIFDGNKNIYKIAYLIVISMLIVLTVLTGLYAHREKALFLMAGLTSVLIMLPCISKCITWLEIKHNHSVFDDAKKRNSIFSLCLAAFTILIGLTIPAGLIASSSQEFSNLENIQTPFYIIYTSFIQSCGIFFWISVLYKLCTPQVQKRITYISLIILLTSLINAFIFKGDYGYISNMLTFENIERLHSSYGFILLNFGTLFFISVILIVIMHSRAAKILLHITAIIALSLISLSVIDGIKIKKDYKQFEKLSDTERTNVHLKTYTFTRTGKNILFIMLDRAMNFFIDPVLENSKIIKDSYTGFTLYKNVIAFGTGTNTSAPSLYGGYEYTPEKINERKNELLIDKHNEALCVLPRLFSEHNWNVSFTDASWANYSWLPDNSIFSNYSITAKNITETGKYTEQWIRENITVSNKTQNLILRNMLYFSFFRISPAEIRRVIYDSGAYGSVSVPKYFDKGFINSLSALENLYKEVKFADGKNCINIIVNNTAHDIPQISDDFSIRRKEIIELAKKYCGNEFSITSFYGNYLGHENIAKFFQFLKDNNCYDNTRIIIAGDHGAGGIRVNTMDFLSAFNHSDFNPESSIPLLMIKDFNASGALKNDDTFMTLADIPYLITKNLSDIPQINPFTNRHFMYSADLNRFKIVIHSDGFANRQKTLTQFICKEDDWMFVKDNVYKPENWSRTEFK